MRATCFGAIAINAYFWVGPRLWQKKSVSQAETVGRPQRAAFHATAQVVAH